MTDLGLDSAGLLLAMAMIAAVNNRKFRTLVGEDCHLLKGQEKAFCMQTMKATPELLQPAGADLLFARSVQSAKVMRATETAPGTGVNPTSWTTGI